nr:hypothetical protein [Lachnospiraceae bacterium]
GTVTVTAVTRDAEVLSTAPSDSVTFDVYANVKSVKLDKTRLKIGTQDGTQYGLVGISGWVPYNTSDKSVRWTASNNSVKLAAVNPDEVLSQASYVEADKDDKAVTTKDGEALAVMGVTPGTVKLTGITTDGSKKLTCNVTVRGTVTRLELKTSEGTNGVNDVYMFDIGATPDVIEYRGSMKANSKMTLYPVIEINGISDSDEDKEIKKTYAEYKKYTDTGLYYRSSDTSVATVDKKGTVTVKDGVAAKTTVEIRVTGADGRHGAMITIIVK